MKILATPFAGLFVIEPNLLGDHRGWLMRTYCSEVFSAHGLNVEWVQLNHTANAKSGTVRGMHFQKAPYTEIKLVRCISGAVLDVVVDFRSDSPHYLKSYSIELSAENKKSLYIPKGFAHGYQTLQDNTELVYQHSDPYHNPSDSGLNPLDPSLAITWPLTISEISVKDKQRPFIDSTAYSF